MTIPAFDPRGRWVAIDVETTGLDPQRDRIIELGAVRFLGGEPVATYEVLVNPGCPLPPQIVVMTGLTDAALDSQPLVHQVLDDFVAFVGDDAVVGHNLAFDLGFLAQAGWERAQLAAPGASPWLDTLELSRVLLPEHRGHSLANLLELANLTSGAQQRHRAGSDAKQTGLLLGWLFSQGCNYPPATLAAAIAWLTPAAAQFPGAMAFLTGLAARQEQAGYPEAQTSARARSGRGSARRASSPGSGGTSPTRNVGRGAMGLVLDDLFRPGGLVAEALDDFESRPEQVAMSRAITKTMRGGGVLAVEAGTGIGKSLAYLAPAVAIAEETGEKVVVSTNTVTLQDQLAERDLPLLARALGRTVNYAVLKGKANYLCQRKLHLFLASALTADPVERAFGLRLIFWRSATAGGDQADLNLVGLEEPVWQLVNGDEGCWGVQCPEAGDCYVNHARRKAGDADIVITNHALICSNLATGGKLLPEFGRLILDEAHHFAAVATEHLGLAAAQGELSALIAASTGRSSRGIRGLKLMPAPGAGWPSAADLAELSGRAQAAQGAVRTLFQMISLALPVQRGQGRELDGLATEIRYGAGMRGLPEGSRQAAGEATERLRALAAKLGGIAEGAPSSMEGLEIGGMAKSVAARAADLDSLAEAAEPGWVYWLEDSYGGPSLRGAPVEVGAALNERLWGGMHASVLVSATLSVMGRFEYALAQLGLSGGDQDDAYPHHQGSAESLLLSSPFDYPSQALLCVPTDLPLPAGGGGSDAAFAGACAAFLGELLPAVGGRSLVLFTSHRMLRQTHSLVAADMAERGLRLYAQGIDGDRSRLLRALRTEHRAVVFGSATFWEGIDVRGPQLSCLVIVKLPFPRPDEPIVAARQERLEAEGKSSFAHYALPQAVLRLRQGFGRLIRSSQDRGAVIILDARVIKRQYGRAFLSSLPETSRCFAHSSQVVTRVGDWLLNPATPRSSGVSWTNPRTGVD